MIITTGRVHNGKIEIDSDSLPEGATVTVLAGEEDETFELSAADEVRLSAAIAQANRGEVVSVTELLHDLRQS